MVYGGCKEVGIINSGGHDCSSGVGGCSRGRRGCRCSNAKNQNHLEHNLTMSHCTKAIRTILTGIWSCLPSFQTVHYMQFQLYTRAQMTRCWTKMTEYSVFLNIEKP